MLAHYFTNPPPGRTGDRAICGYVITGTPERAPAHMTRCGRCQRTLARTLHPQPAPATDPHGR